MVSIGMYITELLRSGGLRMMNRKFIFVGLVLVVFVFPYVLNIGKVEAQVGVKCVKYKRAKRVQCFRQKVRTKNLIIKDLQRQLNHASHLLGDCKEDLHTVEPAHDEIEKLHGSLDECHERKAQLGAVTKGIVGNAITNISKLKTTVRLLDRQVTKIEKPNSDIRKMHSTAPGGPRISTVLLSKPELKFKTVPF